MNKNNTVKNTCFALFFLPALWIMLAGPFAPGLEAKGHLMLGAVIIAVGIWVFKPFGLPFSMGAFFLAAFGLIAGLEPGTVFSGFAHSAVWTLVPALFFGTVLRKTGLGRNIAFGIMRLFRPSYPSLITAWVIIGVVLSIFTPSMTVRVAIMIPIAVQCCELCDLKKGSKGQSLIMMTAFAMAILPGSGWLTGVLWGPIVQGLYDRVPEMAGLITFDSWLSVMLIPQILISLLLVVIGYFVLRPEDKISTDVFNSLKTGEKIKLSKNEKNAGIILLLVFALFITSGLHSLSTAAVCLAAVIAFFILKILTPEDIGTGLSWDMVIYVAMALSINSIFTATGIAGWLSGIIVPAIGPIAGNPMIFALVMLIILFAWRFVDIALFLPTMAILIPLLPSVQEAYGINPLLWLPLFIMAANCFFMNYTNMWAMMGSSLAGERSWTNKHLAIYGIIYFIICLAVIAVLTPLIF
ncbi:MAG: SLC13 family permease [Treponema sp.]|nr:SLC13 family permease [Treponema sp.]